MKCTLGTQKMCKHHPKDKDVETVLSTKYIITCQVTQSEWVSMCSQNLKLYLSTRNAL